MERNNVPKLSTQASMAAKQDRAFTEEEITIAMEIAARIQARIRSGELAKMENQVPVKEEKEVDKTSDEKPTGKPDEASTEEKKPTA